MGSLFGGSKSKSSNAFAPYIKDTFSPVASYAATGADALQRLLTGDTSGFNAYKNATGFDWAAEQGSRGVTANQAAQGLLNSGSTGQALVKYGNDLQQQYAGNYMDQLYKQAQLGLGAGQLIAGAGQKSKSKSKGGLGGLVGGGMAGTAGG